MTRKRCSACERSRALHSFSPDPRHADGRASVCKECMAGKVQKWRDRSKANRDKQREWNRAYMQRTRAEARKEKAE